MKTYLYLALAWAGIAPEAFAFPPAPSHEIYGTVRDKSGRPLAAGEGLLILSGGTTDISRAPSDPLAAEGTNYRLNVPLDANILPSMYQISALKPYLPFSIRVVINQVNYVPIQMTGKVWQVGKPGLRTRLDLTLGTDSDGDGLPDEWEQTMIDSDASGKLNSLSAVTPDGDLDGDGLTNLQEFRLGTYALDPTDGLKLEIIDVRDGMAHLQFVCVSGRNYWIQSSQDYKTWAAASFAIRSRETALMTRLRADETTMLDVYIPVGSASSMMFRLYGE